MGVNDLWALKANYHEPDMGGLEVGVKVLWGIKGNKWLILNCSQHIPVTAREMRHFFKIHNATTH